MIEKPLPNGTVEDKMPNLEGAISSSGRLFPAEGRASLTLTDHSRKRSQTWTFQAGAASAKRWRSLGICPVVWQFTPPRNLPFQKYGDRPYRQTAVTIVVARDVQIQPPTNANSFTVFRVERPTEGANLNQQINRALKTDRVWIDLNPVVKVIHVQDPGLMPQFDRPDSIMRAVGAPYLIVSGQKETKPLDAEDFDASGDVSKAARMELGLKRLGGDVPGLFIIPQWNQVAIRSALRDFTISIKVKKPYKPTAFAHTEAQQGSVNIVWVHQNDNVEVKIDADKAPHASKRILVFVRTTALDDVPAQGEPLDTTFRLYERVKVEERIVPREVKFLIDLAISLVPVVGTIYDLGQLAFMIATGKDFWGDSASASDILLGGSLTVFSIAVPALRIKAKKGGAIPDIVAGADDVADVLPQSVIESPAIAALRSLPDAEKKKLAKTLEDAIAAGDGGAAVKAIDGAVKQGLDGMDQAARQALTDRMVKDLFTPDLTTFQNTTLRVAYDFYKASRGGKKSALEWLLHTEAQWVKQYMTQLFDSKWKTAVKESFGLDGKRVIPLSPEMLAKYDRIIAKGLDEYSVHQKAVRELRGLGQHFELDHIVEQRFLRKIEEWTDAIPEDAALMTFIVPKNAGVAAEIFRVDPTSNLIKYVHQAKTDVMRQLIPHGAEHLFTAQHIADATLYALKSLDAHHDIPIKALKGDFAFLTLAHAKHVDGHEWAVKKGFWEAAGQIGMPKIRSWDQVTDDLVSPKSGFPQVERVNGVWRLAGTP